MDTKHQLMAFVGTHIPFAAMFIESTTAKSPLLTRVLEGLIVAAVGGAVSAFIAIASVQAVTSSQLRDLRAQLNQQHNDTLQQIEDLHFELDNLSMSHNGQYMSRPH